MARQVLLVQPPVLYSTWGDNIRPAHLVPIASFIRQHGFDTRVVDMRSNGTFRGRRSISKHFVTLNEFVADCEQLLNYYQYDLLGVSCWTSLEYVPSLLLGLISKVVNPDAVTVVGGYHASTLPTDFLRSVKKTRFKIPASERSAINVPDRLVEFMAEGQKQRNAFDYIVRGEGETALLKISREGESNKRREEHGSRVVAGEPLEDINDIDYDYSILLDENDGNSSGETVGYGIYYEAFPIHVSRSCPFNCRFCVEKSKASLHWRALTPSKGVNIIKGIVEEFNPRFVLFTDPCFGVNREWKRKFLVLLAQEVGKDVNYWCETNVNVTSKEDLKEFSKLPFAVDFGVESGSSEILQLMNKTTDPPRFLSRHKKLVEACTELSIPSKSYFIWGFPGETKQTLRETLKYQNVMLRIAEKHHHIEVAGQFFFLAPGSDVYENMTHYSDRYGTVFRVRDWWRYVTRNLRMLASSVDPSSDLSLEEENEIVSDEFMEGLNRIHNDKMHHYRWISAKLMSHVNETPIISAT
nr:radical SAM protein [Candidatus Njordarchaeum guaymaensis]